MSTMSDQDFIKQMTRIDQVILGSLIAGVVFFMVIAVTVDLRPERPVAGAAAIAAPGEQDDATDRILITLLVVFAAVDLPLSFVVPNLITARSRRAIATGAAPPSVPSQKAGAPADPKTEISKLTMVYHTQMIVGAAINEGAAFFAGVVYLITKNPVALGVGLLLVAVLVTRFPTATRIQRWVEMQQEKLREEQQTA